MGDERKNDESRAVALAFLEECWMGLDVDAYDRHVHPDAVLTLAGFGEPLEGREAIKVWARKFQSAFPDIVFTVEAAVAEGDVAVLRWRSEQTHTGEYIGIPATGKRASITALQMFEIVDGKIQRGWLMFDPLSVLQQLEIFPRGTAPPAVFALMKLLTRLSRLAARRG